MKNSKWYVFWAKEIGIEYKACLYFFVILVFQGTYLLCRGRFEVQLLHLTEMIVSTYIMGYIQTYLLDAVDEAPHFKTEIILKMILCSVVYTIISYVFAWFERNRLATVLFFFYMMAGYIGALIINKIKRDVDTRQLNDMLREFQNRE